MTFPLMFIFMFLVLWRPQDWCMPWMYGWPFLQLITGMAVISMAMEATQKPFYFPKTAALGLATGLWFISIFSQIAHLYFQGLMDTIPDSFRPCFFLVMLLVVLSTPRRAQAVMAIFAVAALIMSYHAILQRETGAGFMGQPPVYEENEMTGAIMVRSMFFGIFEDPNDLAQILACTIPLVFAVPWKMNALSFAACAGAGAYIYKALTFTESRGGMIGLWAAAATLVFIRLPARWIPYAGIVGLGVSLVLCATMGGKMLDESAQERVALWGDANYAFKHNPVLGIGYGMIEEATETSRPVHNAFVTCYAEMGIIGYWFWFSLLQLGFIGCWRSLAVLKRPRTQVQVYLKRLAGMTMASLAGFAASAYFLSRTFVFPLFMLFALANMVPVLVQNTLPEDHPPLINLRKDLFVSCTIGTVVSVFYIYATIIIFNKIIH